MFHLMDIKLGILLGFLLMGLVMIILLYNIWNYKILVYKENKGNITKMMEIKRNIKIRMMINNKQFLHFIELMINLIDIVVMLVHGLLLNKVK
jgi:hypothetical protein